ncbi:MAG: protein kinase [Anaerolineales bacterium]|nr:protein kinase [Anaerolineales bacterium]
MTILDNRYILHTMIGRGGMGAVYQATDRLTGQAVALKRVFATQFEDRNRESLTREFRTLASLRHPHVVSVLDYGFDQDQQPYFTMEYLQDARTIFEAALHQTVSERVRLLIEVLLALAYLHRRGVLHRDLKPGNVLVVNGQVKVVDFGLAIQQQQGADVAGTLSYMAPEVLINQPSTAASDLYAVGVMAYELLAGRHPFNVHDMVNLRTQILSTMPDLSVLEGLDSESTAAPLAKADFGSSVLVETAALEPTLPTAELEPTTIVDAVEATPLLNPEPPRSLHNLAAIVGKLLSKDPQYRYTDAASVIHDLCSSLDQPLPEETSAVRESFLQAASFIGREVELEQLTLALDDMLAGKGSTWLIGGESGVGKSRLLEEFRIQALTRGALVITGQMVAEKTTPYLLWREPLRQLLLRTTLDPIEAAVLRQIIPDVYALSGLPVGDEVAVDDGQLLDVIAALFRRQQQPTVLMIEDLHWAGQSLEVLKRLSTISVDHTLMIVGSYRSEAAGDLQVAGSHQLLLTPFDTPQIEALSGSMLGETRPDVVELLQRETSGNVWLVVELVRALAEEAGRLSNINQMVLPERIYFGGPDVIMQRYLKHVPTWAHEALRIAAVYGRELDFNVLNQFPPTPYREDWLLYFAFTCAEAGVFEVWEGRWRFAHDKLRESILTLIPNAEIPDYHQRVALALEAAYPDTPHPALADHWEAAHEEAKALSYWLQMADNALAVGAYYDAIAAINRALAAGLPDSQRYQLLLNLGEAYQRVKNLEESRRLYEQVLLQAEAYPLLAADALGRLAEIDLMQGQWDSANERLDACLVLVRKLGATRLESRTLGDLGQLRHEQGQLDMALALCQQALDSAGDDKRLRASHLQRLALVMADQGQPEQAAHLAYNALQYWRSVGNRHAEAEMLAALGTLYREVGAYEPSVDYLQQAIALEHTIGTSHPALIAYLGSLQRTLGRLPEALEACQQAVVLAQRLQIEMDVAYTALGWCLLASHDFGGAKGAFEIASQTAHSMPARLDGLVGLGISALYQNDDSGADEVFGEAILIQPQYPLDYFSKGLAFAGLVLLQRERMSAAVDAYQRAVAFLKRPGLLAAEFQKLELLAYTMRGDLTPVALVLMNAAS